MKQVPRYGVLLIGLDGAGKTTFLEQVKGVCGVKRSLPLEVRAADLLVLARDSLKSFTMPAPHSG